MTGFKGLPKPNPIQTATFHQKLKTHSEFGDVCFFTSKILENGFGGGVFPSASCTTFTQLVDSLLQLLSQRLFWDVFTEKSQQPHQGHSFHHLKKKNDFKGGGFGILPQKDRFQRVMTTRVDFSKSWGNNKNPRVAELSYIRSSNPNKVQHSETMHLANCLRWFLFNVTVTWMYEYMNIWIYEYMNIWIYEYTYIYIYTWIYEYIDIWI